MTDPLNALIPDPRLGPLVELHRDLFRDELALPRLVAQQPPTTLDPHTGERHEEAATRVGMNMSGALLRRLGHPAGFGEMYPWAKALWALRRWCRHEHRKHGHTGGQERPYWRGSLCHQAVRLTVIGPERATGYDGPLSPQQAAQVLRVDRIEEVLLGAFRFIEDEIDAAHQRAIERERMLESHVSPVNTPPPASERHGQPGLHASECPRCRREAAA